MENMVLRRGTRPSSNFNNMTDEQLQEWHSAVLTEAQRENYVNHNLEIVRHYRTEAISRAPAFDLERNAIDAAIARHGLCAPGEGGSVDEGAEQPAATQEEMQPPPMRRPRMEQPQSPNDSAATSSSTSNSASVSSTNGGHYVALAHIFSDAYTSRAEPDVATSGTGSGINNNMQLGETAEIDDVAITKTIDSMGLRRAE